MTPIFTRVLPVFIWLIAVSDVRPELILTIESKFTSGTQSRVFQRSQGLVIEVYAENTDEANTENVRWQVNYPTNEINYLGLIAPVPPVVELESGTGFYELNINIPKGGKALLLTYYFRFNSNLPADPNLPPKTFRFSRTKARNGQNNLQSIVPRSMSICITSNYAHISEVRLNPGLLLEINPIDAKGNTAVDLHIFRSLKRYAIDTSTDLQNWFPIVTNNSFNLGFNDWEPIDFTHTNNVGGIDPLTGDRMFYRPRVVP